MRAIRRPASLENKGNYANKFSLAGFTLIGLIMAIAILGLFLPTIYMALINPVVNGVFEYNQARALALAQEKMEEMFATKASSSILLGYDYITEDNYPDETPISGFTGFNRSVSVTEVAGNDLSTASPGSGFKKVSVTVTWDSGNASVVLTDILGDY